MKQKIVVIVAVVITLAILLGGMMFDVGSVEDPSSILAEFNNISSALKRPISVAEVSRQTQQEGGTSGNPVMPGATAPMPQFSNTTGSEAEIKNAIQEHCSAEGSKESSWKVYSHSTGTYLYMMQNEDWSDAKASNGSLISKEGCMLFACSSAVSNLTHQVYGVDELLRALGHYANMNNNGKWEAAPPLPCVGADSSKTSANGTTMLPESILARAGVKCSGDGATIEDSKFTSGCYLVYTSNDSKKLVSESGKHWFLIMGVNGDNYELACVGSGKETVPKSAVGSDFSLLHCYYVSR